LKNAKLQGPLPGRVPGWAPAGCGLHPKNAVASLIFSGFWNSRLGKPQALAGAAFRYKNAWEYAVFEPETSGNSGVFYIFALLHENPVWAWHKERG